MKFSKVFSLVLFLHLGVIAVFILQPGCRTTQPPTRVDAISDPSGNGRMVTSARRDMAEDVIVDAEQVEERRRSAPRRPDAVASDDGFGDLFADAFNPSIDEPGVSIPVAERGETVHVVQRGESLWAISRQYNSSVGELAELNNLSRDAVLRVGQELKVPTDGSTMTTSTPRVDSFQPSGLEASTTSYTVQRGDTLSGIARRHNTTVQAIKVANGKSSDTIRVGEVLQIPGQADSAPSAPTASAPRATQASASAPAAADGEHVVRAGEFPGSIARQYGMTAQELLTLNNITDPRTLQVGQRLKVRSASGTTATAATSSQPSAPAPRAPSAPSTPRATAPTTPTAPTAPQPVRIRTVEAEPLPEGALPEAIEDEDALFRDAVEIPVIRLNEN
jgi:LysM repeat protein